MINLRSIVNGKPVMGYVSSEEITLPTRFLTLTAHFIAVLTVIIDVDNLAGQAVLVDESDTFESAKQKLAAAAWTAIACFAVEYLGLFMGVSIFMHSHSCLYILLHFIGTILVSLLYSQTWTAAALVGFVIAFNVLPAVLEALTLLFVARVNLFSY